MEAHQVAGGNVPGDDNCVGRHPNRFGDNHDNSDLGKDEAVPDRAERYPGELGALSQMVAC